MEFLNEKIGGNRKLLRMSAYLLSILSVLSALTSAYAAVSADIQLYTTNQSYPLFADCGASIPGNIGQRTLPGKMINESAITVLTDNNISTKIAGKALFDMTFKDNGIQNGPGNDLLVYETTRPEPFSMSVFDPGKNNFTSMKQFIPLSAGTNETTCGTDINIARIDLSEFGIPEGKSVRSLFFDNLGASTGFSGADIADIFPIEHQLISNSSLSSFARYPNESQVVLGQSLEISTPLCIWLNSCK